MVLIVWAVGDIFIRVHSNKYASIKFTLIDYMLICFYLFMIFTASYADDKALALQMVFGICFLTLAYIVVRVFSYRCQLDQLYQHLVLAATIFFIWSFIWYIIGITLHYIVGVPLVFESSDAAQVTLYGTYYEGGIVPRFRGICNSPNNFGMYVMLFGPILFSYKKKMSKSLIVLVALSVLLTFSFTTYLAVAAAFFLILVRKLIIGKFTFSAKKMVVIIFLIAMFILVIVLLSLSPLGEFIYEFMAFRTERAQTGSGRFELFEFSIELIKENPIFGQGLNQARVVLLPLRDLKSTHNNFLEVMLEGGVWGLFFYLLLICSLFYVLFNNSCSIRDRNWIKSTLIGMFIFSNANVTLYADSLILSLAVISTVASYSKRKIIKYE